MNLNIKIGGDIGECGQPESAEPEGFSNLKKVKNVLVYCGKEQVPDIILNEELLMQSITELKDKISELKNKKNPYKDNINILNSGREQFKEKEEVLKLIAEVTTQEYTRIGRNKRQQKF
ncbi:hypothetical protein H8356DRAFT_1425805 [Neocallimastix lanati (nom. inval.)]|nr:hypothetical protein H8356DRAFT_1425805 [Neocallimastix sp. JGI-2020a]